ncbi:hypothetical protein [Paraburkholderia sp. C35]|uniref:hypothetical protein n=1 Tax=Paraburkholderia sp. C35 TaxID=2126993 RepID=UPI000D68878B|nr:hypothetical protein [Paraburkholderia sp. C35]
MIRNFGLGCVLTASILTVNCASADELRSGVYELRTVPGTQLDYRKVYLAVEKGEVQGFFDNPFTTPAANNPDRDPTCRFLLKSSDAKGETITFATWFDGEKGGTISLAPGNQQSWSVKVNGDLPNCEVPTIESGDSLTFKTERNWIGFATIASKRAPLFSASQDAARTKGYLVKDDVVAVLARSGDWVQVDYFARGNDVVRWVRRGDLQGG